MAASNGVRSECRVFNCSSASKMPSQLRHLREDSCISLQSMLSLLSDNLSGRLYRFLVGDVAFDVLLLLDSWSQLCEIAREAFSTDDWRLLCGL